MAFRQCSQVKRLKLRVMKWTLENVQFRTFDCLPVCYFMYIKVQLITLLDTHYEDTVELLMERTENINV